MLQCVSVNLRMSFACVQPVTILCFPFVAPSNVASSSETLSPGQVAEEVIAYGPWKRKRGAGCGGAGAMVRGFCSMSPWQRKEQYPHEPCEAAVVQHLHLTNKRCLCSRKLTASGTNKHARWTSFGSKTCKTSPSNPNGAGTARGAMCGVCAVRGLLGSAVDSFPIILPCAFSPLCFFSVPHRPCSTPPVSLSAVAAG